MGYVLRREGAAVMPVSVVRSGREGFYAEADAQARAPVPVST